MAKVNIRRSIKLPIRRPWIPYIILAIALSITVIATLYVARSTYERDRLRFLNAVSLTRNNINNRLETYITLLRGSAGLFAAQPNVTEEEFHDYVDRIRLKLNYPGIQGIGYSVIVPEEEKDSFIAGVQAEGRTSFQIFPDRPSPLYNAILYLEPEDERNQAAIGYDMSSEPIRRNAMEKARDSGLPTASGKVTLVQETNEKKQAGFLIYVPVYEDGVVPASEAERREKLIGYVYSPFRVDDLLTGIVGNQAMEIIAYQVYDGKDLKSENLLHDSKTLTLQPTQSYEPRFTAIRDVGVAGKTWTVVFSNHPSFDNASQQNLAPFILGVGLVISGLLFFLSRSQFVARKNAELYANKLLHSQKELEKAIGMRDTFISVASHELKTPVTSLKVYAEVLQRKFMKNNQTEASQNMKKMNAQINKLTTLILDLLDVTRIQTGKLAFQKEIFDLGEVVKESIASTQPLSDTHKIILKGASKLQVIGDRDRIGQVLNNFLTNAIKYSPNADKIIVNIGSSANKAHVSIQDFGIGINESQQKKIFNRFYRVSDKDEQTFPGLGIGLYICFEIIKRHHGTIQVKSTKGRGSTFTFFIPLEQSKK